MELLLEIFAQQCELKAGTPEAVQEHALGRPVKEFKYSDLSGLAV